MKIVTNSRLILNSVVTSGMSQPIGMGTDHHSAIDGTYLTQCAICIEKVDRGQSDGLFNIYTEV